MDLTNLMGSTAPPGGGNLFTAASSSLGKDDFMQLLVTQLRNQDPFQPIENQEFVAQLAQFSTLEQTQNMAAGLGDLAGMQSQLLQLESLAQGAAFLGKTVVYTDGGTGEQGEGTVDAVELTEGGVALRINDTQIPLDAVLQVKATEEGS